MSKHLSIIIVPHDNASMRNYRVSYRLVYVLGGLLVLFLLTFGVFVVTYARVLVRAHQAARLMSENAELLSRGAEIDSLRSELMRLQAMGIQIKSMLGVDLSKEDSAVVASLSPVVYSPAMPEDDETGEAAQSDQQAMLRAIPSLWPVTGYVTRDFSTTGGEKSPDYHPGMDIAARRNTPIQTAAEGVVITSGWDDTFGNVVVVDHGFGITTLYGHNDRNLVKVGDRVARGQTIAFLGSTGKSTAPHVHFEVKRNGVSVDPRDYLLD